MVKEKTSLYLLGIVGIVAVVGIVVLLLNGGQVPAQVSEGDIVGFATTSATCTETDGGLVYTTKGTISGGTWKTTGASYTTKTDYCDPRGKLQEYYCSSNTTAFVRATNCTTVNPSYICSNGACVNATPDLIITGINSVTINATNNMTVNFTIKNQGAGYADANYIYNHMILNYQALDGSTITMGGISKQTLHLSSPWRGTYTLPPGDSITAAVTTYVEPDVVADIVAGNSHDTTVTLETDSWFNLVTESDETNNQYTETVTVTSADVS